MSLFNGRRSAAEDAIDAFISQEILLPSVFLRAQEDETHFRVYGHPEYAFARTQLLNESVVNGQPFWHGKVYLHCVEGPSAAGSKVYQVRVGTSIIGEISDLDSIARETFSFEIGSSYVARAYIRADLIGNLVHLFFNPALQLS